MSKVNVEVRKIENAGYNVQRRENWFYAIVSRKTGETILKVAELPGNDTIAFNQKEEILFSKGSILITIEKGKPMAQSSEGKIVWGTEAE